MSFNSIDYLFFLPIISIIYYLCPIKIKPLWLLIASYIFYMSWNKGYGLILFGVTFITYSGGLLVEKLKRNNSIKAGKAVIVLCIICNLSFLAFFKYTNFFLDSIDILLGLAGRVSPFKALDIILPIGISFFTFQSLGYVIDVYRGKISTEKNLIKYALFVSFFPTILSGPIERADSLIPQIDNPRGFDPDTVSEGILKIAYGLFMKIVVADNIALLINPIFDSYQTMSGMTLLTAVLLFSLQIYCDFGGYSLMAIGSGKVLGFDLHSNFESPYFARGIRDFWKRWHISLTSWFRDYIYVPLGGNRKGIIRKYFNMMVVFLTSGLWHGAQWHFVLWGGVNGLLCVVEGAFTNKYVEACSKAGIKTQKKAYKVFCILTTYVCVSFTWLLFRMGIKESIDIIIRIVKDLNLAWIISHSEYALFNPPRLIPIMLCSFVLVFVVDRLKASGINVCKKVFEQQIIFRWILYVLLLLCILYWGVYGEGYEQKQFIYFQF